MSNTDTSPQDKDKRQGILSGLKIDFPAILAVNIFGTFALVTLAGLFVRIPIDGATGQLLEVLKNIVLLMVGFYFGSSAGSKDANQTVKEIALMPTGTGNGAVVTPAVTAAAESAAKPAAEKAAPPAAAEAAPPAAEKAVDAALDERGIRAEPKV